MCARKTSSDRKKIIFSDDFYSDLATEDTLHAILLRSPFAYGRIVSIELDKEGKKEKDCFLFTSRDLPEDKSIKVLNTQIPLLCPGEISYKGQIIAVLLGKDKRKLRALKSHVLIRLDKSELIQNETKFQLDYKNPVISIKNKKIENIKALNENLEQSVISLRETIKDYSSPPQIIAKRKILYGSPDQYFTEEGKSPYIIDGKWTSALSIKSSKESLGAFCYLKAGNLHVHSPTNWINGLRKSLSQITDFPMDKIIITRSKTSCESTNTIFMDLILSCLAALCTIKSGKAVLLELSKKAQRQLVESPLPVSISYKCALSEKGLFDAMDISIEYDAGADNPFAQEILDRLVIAGTGIYRCPNIKINAKAYKSHREATTSDFNSPDSAAFFAMENQMQKIASQTGFSPLELRLINMEESVKQKKLPLFHFTFGRSRDALNAIVKKSDFGRKYTISKLEKSTLFEDDDVTNFTHHFRGVGMACAFQGCGYLGSDFSKKNPSMQISLSADKKLTVHANPYNSKIKDIWIKIIQDALEIDRRSLLEKCLEAMRHKKNSEESISIKKILPPSKKKQWNHGEFTGSPYYSLAFGVCTVELDYDPCSCRENLKKIYVIIDAGKIYNPRAAESEVKIEISKCLRSLVKDENLNCPEVSVQFTQSSEESRDFSNIVYSILPAAYTSALSSSIKSEVSQIPLESDSLFNLREKADEIKLHKIEEER